MKPLKNKPAYPIVQIVWQDAANIKDNWHELATDIEQPTICYSVGYLVADKKDVKILYAHIAPEDERTGECGKGNMVIPTKAILSIKKLG